MLPVLVKVPFISSGPFKAWVVVGATRAVGVGAAWWALRHYLRHRRRQCSATALRASVSSFCMVVGCPQQVSGWPGSGRSLAY